MAAWAAVAALTAALFITSAVSGAVQSHRYESALKQEQKSELFYAKVAGKAEIGSSVSDVLAADLRRLPARRLPLFTGNSNSYGGVSEEIGFDPFTDQCGVECGTLRRSVLRDVAQAKGGSVPQYSLPDKDSGIPQPSLPLWLLVLLAGPLTLLIDPIRRWRERVAQTNENPELTYLIGKLEREALALPPGDRTRNDFEALRQGLIAEREKKEKIGEDEVGRLRREKLLHDAAEALTVYRAGNDAADN